MAFDAKSATEQLIKWIRRYFVINGDENTIAVLGMSGGKDSLVAAALCAQALGPDKVLGVMMPMETRLIFKMLLIQLHIFVLKVCILILEKCVELIMKNLKKLVLKLHL
jgi:NH3-dependent NAD+ synthetase